MPADQIQNRITRTGVVDPRDVLAHPDNNRIHGQIQQDAMKAVLEKLGWVEEIVVSERTGRLLNGHMRIMLALREGATSVPAVWADVTEEEELFILATFDEIGQLATTNAKILGQALEKMKGDQPPSIGFLLDRLRRDGGLPPENIRPPGQDSSWAASAPTTLLPRLVFAGSAIELTTREYGLLLRMVASYAEETGGLDGFVTHLIAPAWAEAQTALASIASGED